VAIEYRRDGNTRTATLVSTRERDLAWFDWAPDDVVRLRGFPRLDIRRGPGEYFFSFGGPLAEIQLAPLNADLGAYFGTTEGVLVIEAPEGNSFGLKGGDVILSVDGRQARGPSSLHRILATYEEGDVVKLEIMRNKSRQTISSKLERDQE
jgi:hypothetical protein